MCLRSGNGADYRLPESLVQRGFGKMKLSGSLFQVACHAEKAS
ncbi:hypothetical protein [Eikenella corrodens]|nr:hypothetical protein [Eikenella corrodens]